MPWICSECNSFNENDRSRECCICGYLRNKRDVRRENFENFIKKVNKVGPLPVFIGVCLVGLIMALFLVLSIVGGSFFTNIVEIFSVMGTKLTVPIDYIKELNIGERFATIPDFFRTLFGESNFGAVFSRIGDYFGIIFSDNSAIGSLGPFFTELFYHIEAHFEVIIDFFKGIRWDKIEDLITYIRSAIEKISGHFSSSKEVSLLL